MATEASPPHNSKHVPRHRSVLREPTKRSSNADSDEAESSGFLSITLHAHLPYVINHGTWPHGLEWLHEAAAETYLPLLRMLGRLERDGIALHCNLDLSPILLEQLVHPVFVAEFPNYVTRKIVAAREDEAFFLQMGDSPLATTARFWQDFYVRTLIDFNALSRDIVSGFRHFNDAGLIRIITSAATHGFLPLLGTDESVHAQIELAVATHTRHFGVAPRGVWLPECGYRPAGHWDYPSETRDGAAPLKGFFRQGIEQSLAAAGLCLFFVDTHLVQQASEAAWREGGMPGGHEGTLYRPHSVKSHGSQSAKTTTVFARDPKTAVQVWSSDAGYPGDFNYLDFHKKRFPGGHRYWKVTGANLDIAHKETYDATAAAERAKLHATHFAGLVREALKPVASRTAPPILNALFDAELFGHWWFEGILWLEAVARELHVQQDDQGSHVELIDCERYLEIYPPSDTITMREGSWGVGGSSQVWLNSQTSWTYVQLYAAEIYLRDLVAAGAWREVGSARRIATQLCREMLLMESSDWQFLITTGAARDYAELRFNEHDRQFKELRGLYEQCLAGGDLSSEQATRLNEIELRDSIFPDLDPSLWEKRL